MVDGQQRLQQHEDRSLISRSPRSTSHHHHHHTTSSPTVNEPEGSEDQQVADWSTVSTGCNNTKIEA